MREQVQQAIEHPQKQLWGFPEVTQVKPAAHQAPQQVDNNAEKVSVRDANFFDVEDIFRLLNYWTSKGETLPRSKDNIFADIKDFVVAEVNGKVIGCAAIYLYPTGLAELRSVAVDGNAHGKGQGSAMTQHLLNKARLLHIPRIIVLTRAPSFFAKMGFTETKLTGLPEKIMKDCNRCPKQTDCDEVAMEFLSEAGSPASYKGQLVIATAV